MEKNRKIIITAAKQWNCTH